MPEQPSPAYRAHEPALLAQANAHRRVYWLGAIALAVVCAAAAVIAHAAGTRNVRNIDGLAGIGGLVALALLIPGLRDPRRHRVLVALREAPSRVVWAYVGKGHGQEDIVLGLEDGKRISLVCRRGEADSTLGAVAAIAPWATLGFTPDHERRFLAKPPSLRGRT